MHVGAEETETDPLLCADVDLCRLSRLSHVGVAFLRPCSIRSGRSTGSGHRYCSNQHRQPRHEQQWKSGEHVITVGSVAREEIAQTFPFLDEKFSGRRKAIKALTHGRPDFVFWVFPDGRLHDARDAHARNVPKGYEHILGDEPDYGGFLRGRIVTSWGRQLIVVYCRAEALAVAGSALTQFLRGMRQIPVPLADDAVVISDNADIYGTLVDLEDRDQNREGVG